MCNLAYDIDGAATHSTIDPRTITLAIRDHALPAYRIDGQAIMLPADLRAWIQTHPTF